VKTLFKRESFSKLRIQKGIDVGDDAQNALGEGMRKYIRISGAPPA
jgi:hypothetical protein